MKPLGTSPSRGVRRLRALSSVVLALVASTCLHDRPAGPRGTARASVALRRTAQAPLVCGVGPTVTLTRARVLLREPGQTDSLVVLGNFVNDTVTITMDVPLSGAAVLYDISAQAMDASGDTVFRARDTVTVREGERTAVGYLQLWYAAPDSAIAGLTVAPRDSAVRFTSAFAMRASGTLTGGGPFSGVLRLGFLSRDPSVAAITTGGAVSAQSKAGTAWIVASDWFGVCDSTTIIVVPPVATVTVTPDTASIVRDGTVKLVAVLKDAGGNQLFNRVIAWSSTNANASVDTSGLVKGLIANKSALIIANSEGKADTTTINVLPKPVAKVTITPKTAIVNVAGTTPLSATAYDSSNGVNADYPIAWASVNTGIATVNAGTGVVTGVATGTASITATANGVADTATITVQTTGITSTVVTPTPDTLASINDSLPLTAKSYTGAVLTPGSYTWTSRDATVASVNATGLVIAKANGTTYVVAVEAGGTKDSARVTVAQKVSAISLTPNLVQRYIGTKQQFTASAVDARGNAVSGTVFTWNGSDPSIASVDGTGLATMLAVGLDTVKATAGTVVGKAVLTVKSAITLISVTPTGVTLDAIGKTQLYTATAYDTLSALMTGITFTWASSNPSVATVTNVPGTTNTATAAANGNTSVQASAQGVTGAVPLLVAQKLVTISVTPKTVTVGQGGSAAMSARGKDANGYFIPGGIFTWSSDATAFVTVNSGTGIVTGVAVGSAHVTAVSGAITADTAALVLVDNAVPPRVSWGRDTVAIGRGSTNNSLPLYLSKPSASPVIINVSLLPVTDTIAYFSPTQITFPAGTTTLNATLNGRNAGVSQVYAASLDGSYLPDTAVLLVQAAAKFAWSSVSVNQGDYYSSQVLLTDPAPAGGVYLTYSYGTAGVAQVSPDPAFIPAGQLAANVNANGVNGGASSLNTTVTPSAPGVTGTPSTVYVYAPLLRYYNSGPALLGAGQYYSDYVYTQATMFHALTVGLAEGDTTIVNASPTVTIPASGNLVTFTTNGLRLGTTTQTASASGYTSGVRTWVISTPHVGICCAPTLNTTSPPYTLTFYAEDSTRQIHPRINPLFVSVTSSDTTVVKIVDTLVAMNAGAQSVGGRIVPGGSGGTAWVKVGAGGHTSDSVLVTVTAPLIRFSFATGIIGADQQGVNYGYVYIPNGISTAVNVTLTSSDTTIAWVTPALTIPSNNTTQNFTIRGHAKGTATLTVHATGYTDGTATVIVTTPRLTFCCNTSLPNFYPDYAITQYASDSLGTTRPVLTDLPIGLRSTNPAVVTVDSASITMAAGTNSNSHAKVHVVGVGVDSIIATAPGYRADTMVFTITTPNLNYNLSPGSIGVRQSLNNGAYASIPNSRTDSVVVHITNPHPTLLTVPDSVKIPAGQSLMSFDAVGLAPGRDTLLFSATGYNSISAPFLITRAALRANGLPANVTTTTPPYGNTVNAYDTIGYAHYAIDSVAIRVTSSDTTVMKVDSPTVHIPKGAVTSTSNTVRFVGPGSARLFYVDSAGNYRSDSSNLVTVTGPSLHPGAGGTVANAVTLGMRQHLGANATYVYTDNAVTGAPLVVTLESTDPTVATVPATVTIPVNSNIGYFDITAHDTVGTVQIKYSATGYAPAVSYVQVGHPQFYVNTTPTYTLGGAPQSITVYAFDQTGATRYTTEDVKVTLSSSNGNVVVADSAFVTILKDAYYNNLARVTPVGLGTATITASDARTAFYQYAPVTTGTITVSQPIVQLNPNTISLGLGEFVATYVTIPGVLATPLTVNILHSGSATSTPSSVVIPAGVTTMPYTISGANRGTDTLTATATGYQSTSGAIAVDSGHILINGFPTAAMRPGDSVSVQLITADQFGSARQLLAGTTFTLVPNGNITFVTGGTSSTTITSITVPVNGLSSGVFYLKAASTGTGTVTITGGSFATYNNSLTIQ